MDVENCDESGCIPFNCSLAKDRFSILTDKPSYCRKELFTKDKKHNFLHFERLVVGGGGFASTPFMSQEQNQGRSLYWWYFRNYIVNRSSFRSGFLRKEDGGYKKACRIVLMKKTTPKRSITNLDSIANLLSQDFKECSIDTIHGGQVDFRDEIQIISQASIFITPPGGVSFSAAFLSSGAALILVSIQTSGISRNSEGLGFLESDILWRRISYIRVYHHQVVGGRTSPVAIDYEKLKPLIRHARKH